MKKVISLKVLRSHAPDGGWNEGILTVCEWSPRVPNTRNWDGRIAYHQADVITIGRKNIIKYWCREHLKEASNFERYA